MWNYNDEINSNNIGIYNDTYSPNNKDFKKKKMIKKLVMFLVIVIVIILILLIILFPRKKAKKNNINEDNSIKNVYIDDEELSPKFDKNIYDYYVLTDKDSFEIKCKLNKKSDDVNGCNQTINLGNKTYYIHQVVSPKGKMYRINIKKKEEDGEELISIDSVEGLDKKSNADIEIKINALSKSEDLTYSIDNGLTYQTSNTFLINENKKIYLVVQDKNGNKTPTKEIEINNIDKIAPTANVEIIKSNKNSVVIKVFGNDNDENLLYSFDGGEFTKTNTFEVKESREVKIYVKDSAGNTSSEIVYFVDKKEFVSNKKYVINYHGNGVDLSNTYSICTIKNNKCNVTLPNIIREGYEILGWSKDKNSKNPEYKIEEEINIDKNIDLYAITRKEVSVTFDYNGINPDKIVKTCSVYGNEKCEVEVPDFDFEFGKIIGWNINNNSESVLVSSSNKIYVDEDITLYALAYRDINLEFDQNGSDSISSSKMKCKVINNNEGCYVTLPTIKKQDAEILGWSINPDNTQAEYLSDNKTLIKENLKLYAITKTNLIVEFYKNGADSITSNKQSCSFYNKNKSCSIKTPTIKRNGANIIGWNVDNNSHSAIYGQNETISVDKNSKYYAITQVPVNISFLQNGADDLSFINQTCTYYNNEKGCSITTPIIVRNGWNIIGFSKSKDSIKSEINANSSGVVTKSEKYYAITSKTVTAHFNKNKADNLIGCKIEEGNGCQDNCTIYNTSKSCEVEVPYIVSKGNEVQLFSTTTNENSLSGYTPGSHMFINSDINLYAIVKNYYRKNTYSIIKSTVYGHVPFEVEASCSSDIYNNYLNFVNRLYNISPYIFSAGKVTFAGTNTFESTWGTGSAGMTYGRVVGYRNVDIICPTKYDRYYLKTIVHELAHAWDSYYKLKYGTYLNAMPDILSLYNKYSNKSSSNRPLRDYSYSSKYEFVADMFAWYYFLYIDPTYMPTVVSNKTYYPSDMKSVMEKYIRIAKNGYK